MQGSDRPETPAPADGGPPRRDEAPRAPSAPEGGTSASTDLEHLVGRALEFEGFLLRRAWGLYYLVWAVVLAIFFVVPGVLAGPLASPSTVEIVLFDAVQAAAIVVAVWSNWWTIGRSARARHMRDALEGRSASRRRLLQVVAIALAITAVVVVVGLVSAFAALLLLDASLGGVILAVLVQVRPWFKPVPPEATLAVVSYAVSVGGSAAVLALTREQLLFSACWLIGVVVWAFAGVYALYRAPEELTRGVAA
jgi:hypothetical protein